MPRAWRQKRRSWKEQRLHTNLGSRRPVSQSFTNKSKRSSRRIDRTTRMSLSVESAARHNAQAASHQVVDLLSFRPGGYGTGRTTCLAGLSSRCP
jgi:hypothetical protein